MRRITFCCAFIAAYILCSFQALSFSQTYLNLADSQSLSDSVFNANTTTNQNKHIKLASVSFITSDRFKLKFDVNFCDGFNITNQHLLGNCEYESCASNTGMKYRCKSCKGDTIESDGVCVCNRTIYPYGADNPCSHEYDTSNSCTEYNADNTTSQYYAGCKCPSNWETCTQNHQVGIGDACITYGVTKYQYCGCSSAYNKTCSEARPTDATDYCLNTRENIRYYDECYSCNSNNNEYYSQNEYWCDSNWIEFPVLSSNPYQ